MTSLAQRLVLPAGILVGVLLVMIYAVAACPAGGGPATPPPLPPSAPACLDSALPCPPWAGALLPVD